MGDTNTLTIILALLAIGVFAFLLGDLMVNKAKARNVLGLIAFAIFTLFLIGGIRSGGIGLSFFPITFILNPIGLLTANYLDYIDTRLVSLITSGLIYYLIGELFSALSKKSKIGLQLLLIFLPLGIILGVVYFLSIFGKGLM